ncbi:hypothetical protein BDW66DRAFT_145389 [Aspergillus desertorum]
MPRLASSATYNYPLPDGTPDTAPLSADNGHASHRGADIMHHVSQTTHGSRERPHRNDGRKMDANPGSRYRGNSGRHTVYPGESFAT